jgi:hypothetical protein
MAAVNAGLSAILKSHLNHTITVGSKDLLLPSLTRVFMIFFGLEECLLDNQAGLRFANNLEAVSADPHIMLRMDVI